MIVLLLAELAHSSLSLECITSQSVEIWLRSASNSAAHNVVRWLIGVQVVTAVKVSVHEVDELLFPSHEFYKPGYVVLLSVQQDRDSP